MSMKEQYREDFSKEEIIQTLDECRHDFEIAVWKSKNPFNVAGIIRTGHNFLAKKFHLIETGFFYKKGAVTTLKWEKQNIIRWPTMEDFLISTKDRNIVAFERRENLTSTDIRGFQYPDNPILLFGDEDNGVPDELLKRANYIVSVPVYGLALDFNVSVAASVACYDWITKHYRGKKDQEIW